MVGEHGPPAPPSPQVAVQQGVCVEDAQQQHPHHGRGRLGLDGGGPGLRLAEHSGTWVHLHRACLGNPDRTWEERERE